MVGAHLTPQELVEVAERPDAAAPPHMERCDTCRRELEGLRVALAAAAEVPVPEPSPFFWERLSARVAAAVEEDLAARSRAGALLLRFVSRITAAGSRRLGAATAVSAALIAALVITFVRPTPGPEPGVVGPVHETSAAAPGDDAALALVAAAMGDLDLEAAHQAGLLGQAAADAVIDQLTAGERRELERLLKRELSPGGSGAPPGTGSS